MSSSNETALVQSGGGASGAYAVGVMKALFNGESPSTKNKEAGPEAAPERLNPDIFTGTSVGSFNATYMASKVSEKVSCSSALGGTSPSFCVLAADGQSSAVRPAIVRAKTSNNRVVMRVHPNRDLPPSQATLSCRRPESTTPGNSRLSPSLFRPTK